MNGLLPTASRACGMPREVIAKDASRLIGGACGLPESGKRATGPSRFYRVTATPGPLVVKCRDSPGEFRGPAILGRARRRRTILPGRLVPLASRSTFSIAPARARVLLLRDWGMRAGS